MASRIRVSARVRVELELTCPQTWHPEVSLEQIHRQTKEWAVNVLQSQIGHHAGAVFNARIEGEPKVTAILVEES